MISGVLAQVCHTVGPQALWLFTQAWNASLEQMHSAAGRVLQWFPVGKGEGKPYSDCLCLGNSETGGTAFLEGLQGL